MNRPGLAGSLILLAFAVVFTVEFHTLLGMFGLTIGATVYFPVAAVVLSLAFGALMLLTDGDGPDAKRVA